MKVAIFGAGAIGGLIGGLLARAGQDVSLIARGPYLEALKTRGCTVLTGNDRFTVRPFCTDTPADLPPQDYVIVAVKAPALPAAVKGIAQLVGPETVIVTAMNGIPWWYFRDFPARGPRVDLPRLDPGNRIASALPGDRIIGCAVHVAAMVVKPGIIRHMADNRLIFGAAGSGLEVELTRLVNAFRETFVNATATPHLRQELWDKLLGNFPFGPIAALTGASTATIGTDPGLRRLCFSMYEEAAEAGRAVGLEPVGTARQRIDLGASLGNFKVSMLQDFEQARRPEIEAIVGSVLEIGRATGVPMPVSEVLYALVLRKAFAMGLMAD